jgi:excisionase family DNA binding protein
MALLNVKEVSEWLQVKRSTIYLWAEQSMIPHMKLSRLLRFDHDEIEAWLQAHRQEVTPEPISSERRHGRDNVDALIAEAKREVYTSCHGKPDQDRATRKGDTHGSV